MLQREKRSPGKEVRRRKRVRDPVEKTTVRRINPEVEEYLVAAADGPLTANPLTYNNLFYARRGAVSLVKKINKKVKIWVREIETQRLMEVVAVYNPVRHKYRFEIPAGN